MKIFRVFIMVNALCGILIDMFTEASISEAFSLFNYYTLQSNLIVAVFLILSIIMEKQQQEFRWLKQITGGVCLWIIVTGTIYHIMLSGLHHPTGIRQVANLQLHYVVPVCMLVYFFLERNEEGLNKNTPLLWTIYPVVYGVVSLVRGAIDGFYPYWFLNPTGTYPDGIGNYWNVTLLMGGLIVVFLILSYLLIALRYVITSRVKEMV